MATTYTFTLVPTWGAVGSLVRRGTGGTRNGTVTDPNGASVTVVQGGVSQAGFLLPDSSGTISFTTTDVPTVLVDFGVGPLKVDATNAITANMTAASDAASSAASAQSSASSAAASAELVGAPAGAAVDARASSGWGAVVAASASYTDVQAALTSAASSGKRAVAAGTITTSSTLTITSDCDLSQLTINYTGTGTAVVVGNTAAATFLRTVFLPKVVNANKSGTGWSSVAGSVGVKLVNLNSCSNVVVPHVEAFETGLLCYGQGQGFSYNNILVGYLNNNQVNHKLDHDSTGWTNENVYVGGRFGHAAAEGTAAAGARHILIVNTGTNAINNNVWLKPSLEGNTPEFHADFAGTTNFIQFARWESTAGPKVRWQDGTNRCQVLYGYNSHNITETFGASVTSCEVQRSDRQRFARSTSGPVVTLENQSSSGNPVEVVLPAGSTVAGADPSTAYTTWRSANSTRWKGTADANPRIEVNHALGRIMFGNGVAASSVYLSFFGSTGFSAAGHFNTATDNTYDMGTLNNRWRDIYANRYVRIGTVWLRDNGGTLQKSTDGSTWTNIA